MLEHLVVVPMGGLCNRLRAIASAKRLASLTDTRCTIAWDWGEYHVLFDDETEWLPYAPPKDLECEVVPGYHHVRHLLREEGGTAENRRVPVTTHSGVVVRSRYVFYAAEEERPVHRLYEQGVIAWLPRPHPEIAAVAERFLRAHLPPGTVGMHVRRTDHREAVDRSPDAAFVAAADRVVAKERSIFLATDNRETLRVMGERYGDNLLHYPKRSSLEQRWPRTTFERDDVVDDLVDLWLLAGCDLVIGSAASSYSRVAVLLNGSPQCELIDRPKARLRQLVGRTRVWRGPRTTSRPANASDGLRSSE